MHHGTFARLLPLVLAVILLLAPLGPAHAGETDDSSEVEAAVSEVVQLTPEQDAGARRIAELWEAHGSEADFVAGVFDSLGRTSEASSRWASTWSEGSKEQAEVGRLVSSSLLHFRRNPRVSKAVIAYLGPGGLREVLVAALKDTSGTDTTGRAAEGTPTGLGIGLAAMAACASRTTGTWASGAPGGRRLAEDLQLAAAVFYFASSALHRPDGTRASAAQARSVPTPGGEFDPAFLLAAATMLIAAPFLGSNPPQNPDSRPEDADQVALAPMGPTLLQWTKGPLPQPAALGIGGTLVDAFGWLLWAGATNSQVAQAFLADDTLRTYVLTGPGAQAWRAEPLRALVDSAVIRPHHPAQPAAAYPGAAPTAAALVHTAGQGEPPMSPGAVPAIGDVLTAYIPAVIMATFGLHTVTASWFLGSSALARRWPGGAPAFEEDTLDVALARVRADPTAYASLAEASGRFGRDYLLPDWGIMDFGFTAPIVLDDVEILLGTNANAWNPPEFAVAAQLLAYEVMSNPDTGKTDPTAIAWQDVAARNDRWVTVMARIAATDPSENTPRGAWGLAVARVYLQSDHADPAVAAWFETILPPPSIPVHAVDMLTLNGFRTMLRKGPLDSSVAPLFDGRTDLLENTEFLANCIRKGMTP